MSVDYKNKKPERKTNPKSVRFFVLALGGSPPRQHKSHLHAAREMKWFVFRPALAVTEWTKNPHGTYFLTHHAGTHQHTGRKSAQRLCAGLRPAEANSEE